jgi:hypothetical protein
MLLRPRQIEQAILSFEELFASDAIRCEIKGIETAVSNETEIGSTTYSEAGVEEGRIFDAVGVEAGSTKLEHVGEVPSITSV